MKFFKYLTIFILSFSCKQNKNPTKNMVNANINSVGMVIENTEEKNDVKIFYGKIVNNNSEKYFTNESNNIKITLDDEQMNRLEKVDSKMRHEVPSLKNCEYILWMKMRDLNENKQNLKKTGINWNEQN